MIQQTILRLVATGTLITAVVFFQNDNHTWQLWAFLAVYARIMANEDHEDDL